MNDPDFELHPRLAQDGRPLGDLPLCRLLLLNDARFPWCVLVPRRAGLVELHDLSDREAAALTGEIRAVSRAVAATQPVTKVNVGALGNLVPQLHVHVVGRHPGDDAWPGPVWGNGAAQAYRPEAAAALGDALWKAANRHLRSA